MPLLRALSIVGFKENIYAMSFSPLLVLSVCPSGCVVISTSGSIGIPTSGGVFSGRSIYKSSRDVSEIPPTFAVVQRDGKVFYDIGEGVVFW